MEKRRRLEQEYYRRLASHQRQLENSEGADAATNIQGFSKEGRRLPADMHKKGKEYNYDQVATHKKGNDRDKDQNDSQSINNVEVTSSSSSSDSQSTNNVPSRTPPDDAQQPPPPAVNQNSNSNNGDDDDPIEPESAQRATNLRSFTRIGGRGYTLPPENRHPYMVSLQLEGHTGDASDELFDVHMCGGVLVAPDLVMTAAHCARYSPPGTDESFQAFNGIEVGKINLSDEGVPFDPLSSKTHKLYYENLIPEELILHPEYNENTYEHDVMLVKVFGKSRYPPIRVAEEGVPDRVTALGWGAESASSEQKYSDRLHSANMDMLTRGQCRNIDVEVTDPNTDQTSTLSLRDHVYDDMMCASSKNRYICYGDAGGPAISEGANNDEDVVHGIISWGYGCVDPAYPAVMAKVSNHYDWIRDTVCEMSTEAPEWFDCPPVMTALSDGGKTQTVTLKLKLDMMSVETGFVIEVRDTREVVAQRQTGYYKAEGNEIVLEQMDLPRNRCYRLIMLDSYGDGNCCDAGGGPARLYWGTDVSYYDGQLLTEVDGHFEFSKSGFFCLDKSPAETIQISNGSDHGKGPDNNPTPPTSGRPGGSNNGGSNNGNNRPNNGNINGGLQGGSVSGGKLSPGGWSGPVTNPEFDYCNLFCKPSKHGALCGNYECVHVTENSDKPITSDFEDQEEETLGETASPTAAPMGVLTSTEFYDDESEYFLTVQFQFDENPEEISWVLYDLTVNEVKVFVDFDVYDKETYKNKPFTIKVSMDGPQEGEKQYAFTVYDNSSDGLCCDHGQGYYKVFLGDEEDDEELLGDDVFKFSSSYYFTLFEDEMEFNDAALVTPSPSASPSARPTPRPTKTPTKKPTRRPTKIPTQLPIVRPALNTADPATARPTNPWEKRRSENVDTIGARWNMRTSTPPGVFTDVGGDQRQFQFHVNSLSNTATLNELMRKIVVGGIVGVCSLMLMQ